MRYNKIMELDLARKQAETATLRRARILGLQYFNTQTMSSKSLYRDILTNDELYKFRVIPINVAKSTILFGITTTTSQQLLEKLRARFSDYSVSFTIISDQGYEEYMKLYDPPKEIVYHDISIGTKDTNQLIEQISDSLKEVNGDDLLAYLVSQAHRLNASDIHLESSDNGARVRLRIDGVLHIIANLPIEKYRVLLSSIASGGNISLGANEAQQGHIAQKFTMQDKSVVDINIRLETVPTIHGMDAVMRLFNLRQDLYTLDNLGLSTGERKVVDSIIARPSGMVLVVGPTGSGKTTTLYSMLNSLNTNERKIITIEDPVEYQFGGITQISVTRSDGSEVDFSEKLKAVLRLDPDIVMVGEIRDLTTAKTALQASLTGHLVLSTFHASSAAAALTRLMDVIGENPLFLSAIRLVMAQRLVRRLDPATKKLIVISPQIKEKLQLILNGLPAKMERPDLSVARIYEPGSSDINPFGYEGQLALREQLVVGDEIRLILSQIGRRFSTQEIEKAAITSGMVTMLQDGVLKVLAGETSLQEIYRVIG